jgi:hypothetical protein
LDIAPPRHFLVEFRASMPACPIHARNLTGFGNLARWHYLARTGYLLVMQKRPKMTKAWKTYFYLMIIVMGIEFYMRFQVSMQFERHFSARNQLEFVLSIISFIGLYGYIYKKKIINKGFWAALFVLIVAYQVWDAYQNYQFSHALNTILPTKTDIIKESTDILVDYIVPLPFFIGLFLYGFKSAAIWNEQVVTIQNDHDRSA